MIILTVRTDKPEAEIGLFDSQQQLAYVKWQAHRELSKTIHQRIEVMLKENGKTWTDVMALVGFEGPGSFTGLRIGLTVVNALGYSLQIPVVATQGEDWISKGLERLLAGEQDVVALPYYGRDANITMPVK